MRFVTNPYLIIFLLTREAVNSTVPGRADTTAMASDLNI
jgi:hypothetical protein